MCKRNGVVCRVLAGYTAQQASGGIKQMRMHFTLPATSRDKSPRDADGSTGQASVEGGANHQIWNADDVKWQRLKVRRIAVVPCYSYKVLNRLTLSSFCGPDCEIILWRLLNPLRCRFLDIVGACNNSCNLFVFCF